METMYRFVKTGIRKSTKYMGRNIYRGSQTKTQKRPKRMKVTILEKEETISTTSEMGGPIGIYIQRKLGTHQPKKVKTAKKKTITNANTLKNDIQLIISDNESKRGENTDSTRKTTAILKTQKI